MRTMTVRKLKFDAPATSAHSGHEWSNTVAALASELHAEDGTRFIPCVETLLVSGETLEEPWVGVVHSVGNHSEPLRTLLELNSSDANLWCCQGLWARSQSVIDHLSAHGLRIPVALIGAQEAGSSCEEFAATVANTAIYRTLPVPNSQAGEFRGFDLTVMICSYKRVHNIGPILQRFCEQTFQGSFEIIIWNNNIDARAELEQAVEPFRSKLDITLIHSHRNYYCIPRLAITHLMRSELLVICDDDVKPAPAYLETFLGGFRDAGDRAVICARGNTFRPHKMNSSAPEGVWERWEHLDFWDVDAHPREIHFMHGSNCVIPRQALLELSALDLPRREFILVDDYWLSYALSGKLKWKIWKIQAKNAFRFDESAEDPEVALWLNPRVRDQRTNFYVYHMSQNWPDGCSV